MIMLKEILINFIIIFTSIGISYVIIYKVLILPLYENDRIIQDRCDLLQSQIDDDGWIYLDIDLEEE